MDEEEKLSLEESDDNWGEDVDLGDVDFGGDEMGEDGPGEGTDQSDPDAWKDEEKEEKAEKPAESEAPPDKPAETDQFKLKYLGEDKTVTREEAAALAQKGMDYDRIRGKLEAAENLAKNGEHMQFLQELAQRQGVTIPELIDRTRALYLAGKENIDMSVALGRVKNQRLERELKSEKDRLQQKKTQDTEKQEAARKRQQDISEFLRAYPGTKDFNHIPNEVWTAVRGGEKMVSAYARYENRRLASQLSKLSGELEAERQNSKNKGRTTGSQSSTGKTKYEDEIDRYWND
ncbi:MAG: hypothetical protein AB7C97_09625 [Oscillospiraceae bacterium]